MKIKNTLLIAIIIFGMLLASGCISGDDEAQPTTTVAPPDDTFFLSIVLDGSDYQDVGLSEIKALPYQNLDATMVKKTGTEVETSWGGTSFYGFMEEIGISNISVVTMVALDGYEKDIEYAQLREALLAWEDETGSEIAVEDGGPIRFVAPGLPSNTWIQNLTEIRVTTAPAESFYLTVYKDGTEYMQVGLSEIKALTYVQIQASMTKSTGEEIVSTWGGTPLYGFLDYVGISGAVDVTLAASDGYQKSSGIDDFAEALLAWEDGTGSEIAEEDGGPIRFIAPGMSSGYWIQNLTEIWVTTG